MMNNKYIAVTIQNYVQFYSIKNVLDKLIKDGLNIDFYVPIAKDDWGLSEMFDDIYDFLKKEGYIVRRRPIKRKYKILLEPYPMEYYFSFNYDYRLKYNYALNSTKPSLTYRDVDNFVYDGILSYSTYEAGVLRVYTKTYVVGKPNYLNFKRKKHKLSKKTLLYLPTYGDSNSIDDISDALYNLKDKYNIITKLHHGTNYFNYEESKRNKLFSTFDKCYDSKFPLEELLSQADIVLSDNSGSIFDALYARVPVAVFSKNLEYFKYENLEPLQYELVEEGYIPYTSNSEYLDNILIKALSTEIIEKQNKISDALFPLTYEAGVNEFIKIINCYLNDEIEINAFKLHRIFYNRYNNLINDKNKLENDVKVITDIKNDLQKELSVKELENKEILKIIREYQNGKLYKLSSKVYSVVHKVLKKGEKNEKN